MAGKDVPRSALKSLAIDARVIAWRARLGSDSSRVRRPCYVDHESRAAEARGTPGDRSQEEQCSSACFPPPRPAFGHGVDADASSNAPTPGKEQAPEIIYSEATKGQSASTATTRHGALS